MRKALSKRRDRVSKVWSWELVGRGEVGRGRDGS